jgi:hypothetical protein
LDHYKGVQYKTSSDNYRGILRQGGYLQENEFLVLLKKKEAARERP